MINIIKGATQMEEDIEITFYKGDSRKIIIKDINNCGQGNNTEII